MAYHHTKAALALDLAATSVLRVQGSGWGWLGYSKDSGKLVLETTANQDPLSTKVLFKHCRVFVCRHSLIAKKAIV